MRPVSLHIEGFGVFREPIEISFESVDYFALVGPTGSGKSTVIDALCFALYGSVPRYGDERLVGRAVSVGKQQATVSLTFEIGTERYRATRVVRVRDGKASTPEALLEQIVDDDTPTRLLASKARDMKPAVEQLLGLPFAHFTKCVVLPQGEFARFLLDEPARRQDLLSRLLDLEVYDRIGRRARERAAGAKNAIELHDQQLRELAFATDEARHQAERRRAALRELYREIDEARADDTRLASEIDVANASAERAGAVGAQLAGIEIPTDVDALAGAVEDARQARQTTAEALAAAQRTLAALDAQATTLPDREPLVRARDAHATIDQLRPEAEQLAQALQQADETAARATSAEEAANTDLETARRALVAARDAHAAHTLAGHLVAGDPCPVCEQPVAKVSKRKRPAALSVSERAVTAAEQAAKKARAHASQVGAERAALVARTEALMVQLDTLTAAVADHPDREALAATLARLDQLQAAHVEAREHEQTARRAEAAALAAEAKATGRAAGVARALQSRREELLRAGLEPPDPDDDIAVAWAELASWAATMRATLGQTAIDARTAAEHARSARTALAATLVGQARELDVRTDATELATLRDDVIEAGTNATNVLTRIDEAIDTARKLREQSAAARDEYEVAELLAAQMRSDRFEKWLLAEALELLVISASETLVALSGGQYSLRYSADEEFVVVDHRNADATRSVRTLSGGETFQASLALALALSDQLASLSAAGGAKLDAIFLDEGFGTLDAETLETVATTIEALGNSGRMVGVVTHVPALAERVPVRYRITRTDRTATVTREDV
jgi:exonuclease SbcC